MESSELVHADLAIWPADVDYSFDYLWTLTKGNTAIEQTTYSIAPFVPTTTAGTNGGN